MAKYPINVLRGSASEQFATIMRFHVPRGARVWDVTYGAGLLWNGGALAAEYRLKKSDKELDLFSARLGLRGKFDAVIYDPPYMIGVKKSDDPRQAKYGGYKQTYADLARYIAALPLLATYLKPKGKLIVKCGDQYSVKERRLYLHHLAFAAELGRCARLVDFFIAPYHRISPTAYQVKARPSAIIANSYYLVGQV